MPAEEDEPVLLLEEDSGPVLLLSEEEPAGDDVLVLAEAWSSDEEQLREAALLFADYDAEDDRPEFAEPSAAPRTGAHRSAERRVLHESFRGKRSRKRRE